MGDPAAASDWRRERRRRLLAHVDPARETGLELGPRTSPIVTREDGHVLYADRLSTPELRAFYRDTIEAGELDPAAFVDVDLVVPDGASLAAALGERGPVDYVVASHVLEHLADPVGWLADIAACLREGGHLCLAVPDKRFTFDHLREPTLARELLGWAVERPRAPTPGQVYDHLLNCAEIDGGEVWLGHPAPRRIHAGEPDVPRRIAEAVAAGGERPDVHCTVWTPWSFARAWTTVIAAGLLPLALVALDPTRYAEIEFFATFRKLEASPDERARLTPELDPAQHHALPGPPALASTKPRRRWFGRD